MQDFDTIIEAPETPAPVFAVRAFKHALFGTPKPTEILAQFDNISAKMAAKEPPTTNGESATAPNQKLESIKNMTLPGDAGASPSKPNGILMTPGTTRRNKTVSFGAGIVDNEGKKVSRSGLPNSCPGKFPSPWTPKFDLDGLSDTSTTSTASQKRTKLTQTLHDIRDSSRNSKSIPTSRDDLDLTLDFMEPRAQSGKYWKQQYETYAANTQRDVKKLLMKQKAAKQFAMQKQQEIVNVSAQLELEQAKSTRLEANVKTLEREMLELKEQLQQGSKASPFERLKNAQDEASKLRLENWKLREDLERHQGKPSKQSPRKRPASTGGADIWADVVMSSPFVVEARDKSSHQRARSHATPKKGFSPLKQRDINTLEVTQTQSLKKPQVQTVDPTPKRDHSRPTPRSSRDSQILPDDSIDLQFALPQPSPGDAQSQTPQRQKRTPVSASNRGAGRNHIDELVDKYSPTKEMIQSSPPPAFDRLALPICMPFTQPGGNSSQAGTRRVEGQAVNAFEKREDKASDAHGVVDDANQKRSLSEEKKLAAMQRIAARRAAKGKA